MFEGKQICIDGVYGEEKAALTKTITSRHGVVVSYVTRNNTLYFIGPSNNNSQAKQKAIKYGISILTIEQFDEIINEKKHKSIDESFSSSNTPKKQKVSITNSTDSSSNNYVFNANTLIFTYCRMKSSCVNRNEVSIELAKLLIQQKEDPYGMLPILSQQSGIGKTHLLFNFRNVLTKQNVVPNSSHEETSENLMKSALIEINVYRNQQIHEEFNIVDFSGTLLLLYQELLCGLEDVDRTILTQEDIAKLDKSINVVNLLRDLRFEDKSISMFKSANNLYQFCYFWSLNKLFPLLLFFDQLSYMEEDNIIKLWKQIGPLMGCNKLGRVVFPQIFLAFAGKTAILTKLSRGNRVSLTPSRHLTLELLSVDNIMELIDSLTILKDREDVTMKNILVDHMKIGDNYEYFCQMLHQYSNGGLPRLVKTALHSFAQLFTKGYIVDFSERNLIDSQFHRLKPNNHHGLF